MKPLNTLLATLCLSILTNLAHADSTQKNSALHPKSIKVAAYFDHAIKIVNTTMNALQGAQYPEDIPNAQELVGNYFDRFGNGNSSYDFALVSSPCHEVLELKGMLYEAGRNRPGNNRDIVRRFAAGETPKMLAELHTQLNTLQQTKDFCVNAAQYYYVARSSNGGSRAHAIGTFGKVLREDEQFVLAVDTPSTILHVTLENVLPVVLDNANPASHALTNGASLLISNLCKPKQSKQAVASTQPVLYSSEQIVVLMDSIHSHFKVVPPHQAMGIPFLFSSNNNSFLYATGVQKVISLGVGTIKCDDKDIVEQLLAAGLARLDYRQNISAESHPKLFAAVLSARENKRGMWGIPRKPASMSISSD